MQKYCEAGKHEAKSNVFPRRAGKNLIQQQANKVLAGWTGLEPATSAVTGLHSNQLNYHP